MATTFNVQGPTAFQIKHQAVGTATGTSFLTIGHTDNDDLISVAVENIHDPYYSTETGREPAALIYQGSIATITATLIKWDTAVVDTLRESVWAGAGGTTGTIGQNQFDDTNFTNTENLQVKLLPTYTSNIETYSYLFYKCYVESMSETNWGNAPKKLVLSIKAVTRSGSDRGIYTRASS